MCVCRLYWILLPTILLLVPNSYVCRYYIQNGIICCRICPIKKTFLNSPHWFSADFWYNMMLAVAGTNAIGTAAPKPSVQASLRCWWWYCLCSVWADSCRGMQYWMYQHTYLVVSSFYSSAPMPLAQQHPNQACRPHWDVGGDIACTQFGRILAGVRSIECTNTPI